MKLTLIHEKKQPLLGRRELLYRAEFAQAATPSKDAVKKEVIALTKAPEQLVIIHKLHTSFGTNVANVDTLIYDDQKSFDTFAVIHKRQKKEKAAEGQQPAAPAAKKK